MTDPKKSLFDSAYIDNHAKYTIWLFHGTGGGMTDFFFLDELLDHKVNLLGIKGNISEHGMARYFKRHGHGVFDEKSIHEESKKLAHYIQHWSQTHDVTLEHTLFLGYSNGANILLALAALYPTIIQKALFLHPMLPLDEAAYTHSLSHLTCFISTSPNDEHVPQQMSQKIIHMLAKKHAHIVHQEYPYGHTLTHEEISDCVAFIQNHTKPASSNTAMI
jgi:phospholipase/carboxylesterase